MKQSKFVSDTSRWAAVSNRDPDAEGCFVYCVKTTKIFCRPNCHARLARRSNVEFFNEASQAEAAGYRACKRCQPTLERFVPHAENKIKKVTSVLDQLSRSDPIPSLDMLAREAGMTKYHFHRSFKKMVGCTPREYALSKHRDQSKEYVEPIQSLTPSLTDELSLFTDTTGTPSDGFGLDTSFWNSAEDQSLMLFNSFDWQDIHIPELNM